MSKYRVLIADNDGTTLDSEKGHHIAIEAASSKHGGGLITFDEWWKNCSGKGHEYIYDWLIRRSGENGGNFGDKISQADFKKECLDGFGQLIEDGKVPAKPGMIQVFQIARDAGLKVAINSNTAHATVEEALDNAGVLPLVNFIFCADDAAKLGIPRKPAPDTWGYVAREVTKNNPSLIAHVKKHGIRMSETNLWEDSDTGLRSAREAGGLTIQVADQPSFNYVAPRSPHAHLYSTSGQGHIALITGILNGKISLQP